MSTITQDAPRRNSQHAKSDDQEPLLIAEWPIKRGEIARVSIENYKGTWLISLRKWFEAEDGQLRATTKGISLSVKHLRRISVAMDEALTEARRRGLIPADEGDGQ
jgi:Transcriptional Coactivator p15 (PC4)